MSGRDNTVNVMLTSEELAFVLGDCEAAAVFTGSAQAARVAELARDLPGRPMVVAFNGGVPGCLDFGELLGTEGKAPRLTVTPEAPSTIGYTSGTTGHLRCAGGTGGTWW